MDPIVPEFLRDFAFALGPIAVGLVVAAFVHEGGHAVFGMLAGIRPRVVNVGVGRPWGRMRLGGTWFVVRIGLLAAGWNSHEPSDRRWALALLVAGGPLANLLALTALYGVTLLAPESYPWLEPFGFAQACAVALTLFPTMQTMNGRRVPTDGLRLFRLIVQGRTADLRNLHAKLLATVRSDGASVRPLGHHSREILYEALRQDRWTEAWACRDAVAGYRALLVAPDLGDDERAFVLCDLVVQYLLLGYPEVDEGEIGSLAAQARRLSAAPRAEAVRGAVLVSAGHHAEGKPVLLAAIVAMKDRGEILSATSALAHAAIGTASATLAGRSAATEWFNIARSICGSLAVGRAIERGINRMQREAFAEPHPRETRRAGFKRWLAGADLP